jgi:hypothetical protein
MAVQHVHRSPMKTMNPSSLFRRYRTDRELDTAFIRCTEQEMKRIGISRGPG